MIAQISVMRDLIEKLNKYADAYEKGESPISDQAWDDMYFILQKMENETNIRFNDSPTQKVRYELVSSLQKVAHNHPMLSLDKTKDWNKFLQYFGVHSVVGMLKLDGLTCSLRYVNGRLVSAETRGNGIEGEDILHNARVIKNIPKRIDYTEEFIVDGELICTEQDFKPFAEEYSNARNFAAGSARLLDSSECAKRNLRFVVWNVVVGPHNRVLENFVAASQLGFTVVPWTSSFDWDAKDFLIEKAKEYGYPIDGLVGRFDNIEYGESLGITGHHTKAAYAFKFYDETYTTHLNNIEWSMGRTGVLTPIACFKAIEIEGAIIERASLHNISVMQELLGTPYQGQTLEIFRANMIIPQVASAGIPESKADIEGITFDIPSVCPVCGAPLKRVCEVDSETLVCDNPECLGQLINRLDHFCSKKGLDIKGLSKATLEKLIEYGWLNEPADLYKLKAHRGEWTQKPGFGVKSVDNILAAIENSRFPKLEAFICALGIPHVGRTLSKELTKHFSSYETFRNAAMSKWDFTQIEGVAGEKASAIWNFNFAEADQVSLYMFGYTVEDPAEANNLEGSSICITGRLTQFKNRNELIQAIENHSGKVVSGVTKNTTYLINNDNTSTSTKNVAAKKLGIPIVTEEEFIKLFLS